MNSLQNLESLERLQSLERLNGFDRLEKHIGDYRNIVIEPDSVIYCDIPYEKTGDYRKMGGKFDYDAFYDWCEKQTEPVFISSYQMPQDRFKEIATFQHRCDMDRKHSFQVKEKVFVSIHQQEYSNFLF